MYLLSHNIKFGTRGCDIALIFSYFAMVLPILNVFTWVHLVRICFLCGSYPWGIGGWFSRAFSWGSTDNRRLNVLFRAIKVILHGCLCWSKPIQNAEEVIYWTRYIFTLFARTWVCTVFEILATFWIFTIKDTTKSLDFVLLSFPLFIFNAHGIMFIIARCSYLPIIDATILFPWTAQSNIPYNFSLFAHD